MDAGSRGLAAAAAPWDAKIRTMGALPLLPHSHSLGLWRKSKAGGGERPRGISCCRGDSPEFPKLGKLKAASAVEMAKEWRLETKKGPRKVRMQALPALPFPSPRSRGVSKQQDFYPRCSPRNTAPQSRDTPPKRGNCFQREPFYA